VTDNASREQRPSIGELVSTLSEQLSALVHSEIALAKAEMAEKAKRAGIGIGLFAGAAVFAFFGTGVLVAAMVLGLAEALPAWLAALIVSLILFGITALLGFLGKKSLNKGNPPVPERAQASIRADVDALMHSRAEEEQA
jgi:lipopolysaccharide export LptBFGC system permease protein LptF